jgi:hypothetical protein
MNRRKFITKTAMGVAAVMALPGAALADDNKVLTLDTSSDALLDEIRSIPKLTEMIQKEFWKLWEKNGYTTDEHANFIKLGTQHGHYTVHFKGDRATLTKGLGGNIPPMTTTYHAYDIDLTLMEKGDNE